MLKLPISIIAGGVWNLPLDTYLDNDYFDKEI